MSAPVVVYCVIGYRSEKITKQLRQMGYHAQNLYGGLFEWVNQHHSVVNSMENLPNGYMPIIEFGGIWLREGQKGYAP
ncbi:MAG: rhodanese-like domain-containing protein [Bacteroidota bacterium]